MFLQNQLHTKYVHPSPTTAPRRIPPAVAAKPEPPNTAAATTPPNTPQVNEQKSPHSPNSSPQSIIFQNSFPFFSKGFGKNHPKIIKNFLFVF